jgi:hypothetical protein
MRLMLFFDGRWGGWTLDGFDQQLYTYVVPTVMRYGACRPAPLARSALSPS